MDVSRYICLIKFSVVQDIFPLNAIFATSLTTFFTSVKPSVTAPEKKSVHCFQCSNERMSVFFLFQH